MARPFRFEFSFLFALNMGLRVRCCSIILLVFFGFGICQQEDVLVETSLGKIQGSVLQSQRGADIYAFRGIRYAQAPINELRFKDPVPVQAWTDTLDATADSLICPQPGGDKSTMSEDCLKLNVYSRDLTGAAPVMVYIHGGSNKRGSGHSEDEAGPQYLLDYDVVMVSLNYRLGALGFLSTRTAEAPGNFGYLDQVLALKWVKTHIANFGGNPDSVTIYGMSAGSMAVTLLLASPLSRGLFHRAIAMSGSTTNTYAIDNLYWTQKLARELSCPMYNPKDVLDCLRVINWADIIDVCASWEPYGFINMKWNYEVDGHFLMKHPNDIFLDGDFNKVTILTGFTKHELDFSAYHQENNTGLLNDISVNFDLYAPEFFLYNETENVDEWTGEKKSDNIEKFYLGSTNATISSQNLADFGKIFSDSIISHGVHRLVQLAKEHVDVYYYRTDYVGSRSLYMNPQNEPRGVGHADDLQYVMPSDRYGSQISLQHPDMFMVDRMTYWWTTFARTGAPVEAGLDYVWEPTTANKTVTLYNDKEITIGDHPYLDRFELWDSLFPIRANGSRGLRLSIWLIALTAIFKFLA